MLISYLLIHYLFPHHSNNHRPKLLHSPVLLLISISLLIFQMTLFVIPRSGLSILGYSASIPVEEIVRLTNERRAQAGLSYLEFNSNLAQAARLKGEDMINRDYWAHVAPDGTEPWRFFSDAGYKYRFAGENLARDFSNPPSAIDAWMASASHKENILSPKYEEVGIAVVEGDLNGVDTTIIVQLFGTTHQGTVAQVSETEQEVAVVAEVQTGPASVPGPTLVPSPISSPAAIAVAEEPSELEIEPPSAAGESTASSEILVSPFTTTRGISLAVVGFLLVVLVVDWIVVSRRRIARIGGRALAHISFLGMILAIALIVKAGQIL